VRFSFSLGEVRDEGGRNCILGATTAIFHLPFRVGRCNRIQSIPAYPSR
jgi:hypothetical protein